MSSLSDGTARHLPAGRTQAPRTQPVKRLWAGAHRLLRAAAPWLWPEHVTSPQARTPYLGAPPRHWPYEM
jgi:hypothetical protein